MTANPSFPIRFAALALVVSCARPAATPAPSSASASTPSAPPATQAPSAGLQGAARGALAPLASEPLVVLPVQTLRLTVPDWSDKVGAPRARTRSAR